MSDKPKDLVRAAVEADHAAAAGAPTDFARALLAQRPDLQHLTESTVVRYVQAALTVLPKPEPEDMRFAAQQAREARAWKKRYLAQDSLDAQIRDALTSAMRRPIERARAPESGAELTEGVLVVVPTDLHFGQPGRRQTYDDLMRTTERLVEDALRWGRPAEVVIPVGSDWCHVDTDLNTTTKGTPQTVDVDEPGELVRGALFTLRRLIERWRQVAHRRVTLVGMFGNHDLLVGKAMLVALELLYQDADDVHVDLCFDEHQYHEPAPSILLGFHHGHGTKPAALPARMARDRREAWGRARWCLWFTGHLHTRVAFDEDGCFVHQCPSLARSGRWGKRHGYCLSNRGQVAFLLDPARGPVAELCAYILE